MGKRGPPKGCKMPEASVRNLIPFKKGDNGQNLGGDSLTSVLKRALTKEKRKELIESTLAGAILREPTAFREVWDRVEGKVPVPVVGAGGGPIVIRFEEDGNER